MYIYIYIYIEREREREHTYNSSLSLTSTLGGVWWSTLRPRRFIPSTHFTGGWLGLRKNLDGYGKSLPQMGSNHGPTTQQLRW